MKSIHDAALADALMGIGFRFAKRPAPKKFGFFLWFIHIWLRRKDF